MLKRSPKKLEPRSSAVPETGLVSAVQLAELTGLPLRTVQFWTLARVLTTFGSSANPGRGRTRMYPVEEVQLARMLQPLHAVGFPSASLQTLADQIRPLVRWKEKGSTIRVALTPDGWELLTDKRQAPDLVTLTLPTN